MISHNIKTIPMKANNPRERRDISGVLLLDKPINMTSNAALQKVKYLLSAAKAGHTGSLDPLADGMLPICLGFATKFSQFLLEEDKFYRVTAQLGIRTTTGDAEGEIVEQRELKEISNEHFSEVLNLFRGAINQIPPMYSAIKYKGKPLYALARQGLTVERQARSVMIYDLELLDKQMDRFSFSVHCSKGTYVRTLVEDIGEALGCGAYVLSLRRTRVGSYHEAQMISLADIEARVEVGGCAAVDNNLLSVASMMQKWPELILPDASVFYMRRGQAVMVSSLPAEGWVRLYSKNGDFLGMGEALAEGKVAPRKLVQA
jgi:tRNA pseudouridine55 synthase